MRFVTIPCHSFPGEKMWKIAGKGQPFRCIALLRYALSCPEPNPLFTCLQKEGPCDKTDIDYSSPLAGPYISYIFPVILIGS